VSTYDTNIPGAFGAGGYAQANLAANTAYKNTLARINQKRTQTLRQYGYLGDIDPNTGVLSNMRVDPNNAYGGLQGMLRHQAQDFQGAQDAASERHLVGGLAHRADSDLRYQHGAESAQFGQGLTDTLGGFQDDQNQAAYTRDQALYQAQLDAARLAIENQQFSPADYSGLDYSGYGEDPVPDLGNTSTTGVSPRAAQTASKVMAKVNPGGAKSLSATSQALNAKYGSGAVKAAAQKVVAKAVAPKPQPNAYTNGKKKRG
jgi:hypothetical protein